VGLKLSHALRFQSPSPIALVGAGGKTTALFQLAGELSPLSPTDSSGNARSSVIVAAATHLGVWQAARADRHLVAESDVSLAWLENGIPPGVTLVTGPLQDNNRLAGVGQDILYWLREVSFNNHIPLLIEADGARQKSLKAPAEHEPPIPDWVEMAVVVAGLSGLGQPLTGENVHRPEIFARLSGLKMDAPVSSQALRCVLAHPSGGLKNIPPQARRVVLLNQADTPALQSIGGEMAPDLLESFDAVIVASLQPSISGRLGPVHAVHERAAGIILAAGEAKRFGRPKQLLDWRGKPFVRQIAETALAAHLSPVILVTGAHADEVAAAVQDLPLTICHNPSWQKGQSSSLQAGLQALGPTTGAAIFLLADQPQVSPTVLRALVERHSQDLSPIVAPQVRGQRANPVLFDRAAFPALMSLTGDVGGRAVFSKFPITCLPWHDDSLLVDVDRPEDLERLA
jgi:molybdenum cofactor cytidylyltransferase